MRTVVAPTKEATLVETPRAKPLTLQGPHHADQATSFWLATAVVEWPEPLLNTGTHSAPDRIAKPRGLSQMYCPPATQWSALVLVLVGYWLAFALYPLPGADFDWSRAGVRPDDAATQLTGFPPKVEA